MEGNNIRSPFSSGSGSGSLLGNMVHSDTIDSNVWCGGVHSHWPDDHKKCGVAYEVTHAGLYLIYDPVGRSYS
jgi:hypothetical protein